MASYQSLIKLDVLHTYYKSGRGNDWLYIPVSETAKMLRNRRMVLRMLGAGLGIMVENYGEGTPKITIDEDLEFVFGLSLKNPALFLGVTELNEAAPSTVEFANGCRMYFYTDGAATQLKYKVLHAIYSERFSFRYSDNAAIAAIKVTVKNEAGSTVVAQYDAITGAPVAGPYQITAEGTPGEFITFFDLSKQGQGYYTLEIKNAATNANLGTMQVYVNDELSRANVSGVMKIDYAKPTPPVAEKSLTISLERVETKWKYYIVNKSSLDLGDLDIVLQDKSGDAGPVYLEYTFTGNPNNGGGGQPSPSVGDSVSGVETLVFESAQKIPYYEEPKQRLELRKINQDEPLATPGIVLINDLPNPLPAMRVGESSKVYVYV